MARLSSSTLLLWCKECFPEGGFASLLKHRNIWNSDQRKDDTLVTQNCFIRWCKNQTEPIKHDPQRIFMNFYVSLMGLRREKWIFEGDDMSGREKTIKTSKMVKKILKIFQIILARVQEVCLPDCLICAFTL